MAIAGDLPSPGVSYLALYVIYLHVLNTRTSTHWKLNAVSGKVEALAAGGGTPGDGGDGAHHHSGWDPEEDHMMAVLTSRIPMENGEWKLEAEPSCSEDCQRLQKTVENNNTAK